MKRFFVYMSALLTLSAWLGVHKIEPPNFSNWTLVNVRPGQTEWELGKTYCPSAETAFVVNAIESRNHTEGNIQPGESLWVPTATKR